MFIGFHDAVLAVVLDAEFMGADGVLVDEDCAVIIVGELDPIIVACGFLNYAEILGVAEG